MAITKTIVYSDDNVTNAENVAAWFNENGKSYFDSATAAEGVVTLTVGGSEFAKITIGSLNMNITAKDISGALVSLANASSSTAKHRVYRIWKCTNGIMLALHIYPSEQKPSVFITKDSSGNVVIAAFSTFTQPSSTQAMTLNATSVETATVANLAIKSPLITERTVLCPLMLIDNSGCYLPHMSFMPYAQYTNCGVLNFGNARYMTSGVIAIKD